MITETERTNIETKLSFPKEIQMYSRKEVAILFNTSEDTISSLVYAGCLTAIKIGKSYSFTYSAIKDFEQNFEGADLSNEFKMRESVENRYKCN
ncbi:helix-turn-helix domain-containing protein [Absicoccus intestinalis]|uniref:Helix-turn-helix domain-containing protein n=1 Tax=Absicoccus intestinalis TaxID=2926319 RepID=A0ABU4WP09_9FIRM|nr:helix-turn-helix domain-containing protein [Absicoccus sp. CLA-KB-P134]MDX8418295.1 helix-turn-helix domain-containing protein [Absicoccus sp. CLA-KB-P134]